MFPKEIINIISFYLDLDDVHQLKKIYPVNLKLYLKYSKLSNNEKSFNEYFGSTDYPSDIGWACSMEYYELAKLFLKSKYRYGSNYMAGLTDSIEYCSKNGNLEMVKLISKKVCYSPAMIELAIVNNHEEIVKYLIDKYRTNISREEFGTFMYLANINKQYKILKFLKKS